MSAAVVTVAQQKGGAGKTTLVVQLATAWRAEGRRVAIVDIDPQASLTGWARVREHQGPGLADLRHAMVGGWRLGVELDRLRSEADVVLVDTPPHAETDAKAAIRAADLILVPVQPSPLDLWASRATIELAAKESRRCFLVLNRVPARGRVIEEASASIAREGWPALRAQLGNRQSYVSSFGRGRGVIESEPRSAAAVEVGALATEIRGLL